MKYCWVFWGLILWLMAPCLDLTPESGPQEKWIYLVPQHCKYPWFKFGKCGCYSMALNCSFCHYSWFEACYEKTTGYLRRTKVLWWLGINPVTLDMIFKPLMHHFDFHCVPCVALGNSGLSSINQCYMAFRMNQASVQHFETDMRNQTTGPAICPRNASDQGSWRQQWLLQLSDLVWTSGTPSDKNLQDFPRSQEFSEISSSPILLKI
uniref:RIKEN cDNA 6430550D23 gene n=1 Tax=Nannospalax galili TaxID=1026970 RepID=A0A8C6RAL0_NANGA